MTASGLRDQTSLEYILRYIFLPAGTIFTACSIGWFIVYRSRQSSEIKSLAAMLTMVSLSATAASVHNIFATTLCSFFVPLSVSVVFGEKRITNIVGGFCIAGEVVAMCVASQDLRGKDPYFLRDCLMLFIVFGISWYATLLLMKNEQEKRNEIQRMWQLENEITDRKREQEELRLRLEQHQIIMNQTTDILFEWDIRKDTLTFYANWHKKFGYDPIGHAISGRIPLSDDIHSEDMPAFVKIMKDTAAGKQYSEAEFRIKDSKKQYCWCRIRATTQYDDSGHAIKAVGVIQDINAEKKEKQKLMKMAQRDPLTGIYNKSATNALVTRHMAGDNILSAVAAQLRTLIRSSDVVGRISGDEFLVYLAHVENEDAALCKAKNIHPSLEQSNHQPCGKTPHPLLHGRVSFALTAL